jgi:hypothetical protein
VVGAGGASAAAGLRRGVHLGRVRQLQQGALAAAWRRRAGQAGPAAAAAAAASTATLRAGSNRAAAAATATVTAGAAGSGGGGGGSIGSPSRGRAGQSYLSVEGVNIWPRVSGWLVGQRT